MSNTIPPSELLAFQEAMRGKRGDFDSWLECNNEAEVIAYINAHAAAVSAADNAALRERVKAAEQASKWESDLCGQALERVKVLEDAAEECDAMWGGKCSMSDAIRALEFKHE